MKSWNAGVAGWNLACGIINAVQGNRSMSALNFFGASLGILLVVCSE